jgi:hypothetical protein
MKTSRKVHEWMVNHLEKPFLEAEMFKTEPVQDNDNTENTGRLLGTVLVLATPLILALAGVMHG